MKLMLKPLLTLITILILLSGIDRRMGGQQVKVAQNSGEIKVGKPLFVSSATVVCGPLEQTYPFAPKSYGKVGGYSPATSEVAKLVLYTRSLDKNFFRLAAALDPLVAHNKELAEAIVIVMEEKGAQRGGYTVEELIQRRKAIQQLVAKNKVRRLSFFISAPNAGSLAPRLGLAEGSNLLLARLGDSVPPGSHPIAQWLMRLDTTKLSDANLKEVTASLEKPVNGK